MRIVSTISEREKVTTGPLIDETKRVKVHGTIIGARTKDVLEVATRQALFQILR
jgi:hypothetical protein